MTRASHLSSVLAGVVLVCQLAPAQTSPPNATLELQKKVEDKLAPGESRTYEFPMNAGEFVFLLFSSNPVEGLVSAVAPDGSKFLEVASTEPIPTSWIAPISGTYRLQVSSRTNSGRSANFELTLRIRRAAGAAERTHVEADRAFREGLRQRGLASGVSFREALKSYQEALPLYRAAPDSFWEARTLRYMGQACLSISDYRQAIEFLTSALPLLSDPGRKDDLATVLNSLGVAKNRLGDRREAIAHYQKALEMRREQGNETSQAVVLTNLGTAYLAIGEMKPALASFTEALAINRKLADRQNEANSLAMLGRLYAAMGEHQQSLDFYEQALASARAARDRLVESSTLNNIGTAYAFLGDPRRAISIYDQALPIAQAVGSRDTEASVLNNAGWAYDALGERQRALDYLNRALTIYRAIGNRRSEAYTLTSVGRVYRAQREYSKAAETFDAALSLRQAVGDRGGEALTLYQMALLERDRGDLAGARTRSEATIDVVESLRKSISGEQFRTAYMSSVKDCYDLHVDILMQLDRQNPSAGLAAAALETSERSRARTLVELLSQGGVDIREGADSALLARESALRDSLNAQADALTQLKNSRSSQLAPAVKELERITAEYESVEARIRAVSPRYAALAQPAPASASEIQRQLDAGTLLLEYQLGDQCSYLWVVSPTRIGSYTLPARSEIEGAARRVYELLKSDADDAKMLAAMQRLSRMVLLPAAAELGNKRLLVVADGSMAYVPFAALASPSSNTYEPLIVRHEIVLAPSATALAVLRQETSGRSKAAKSLAVLADPVFERDDPRVRGVAVNSRDQTRNDKPDPLVENLRAADVRLTRLAGTRKEAAVIAALVPAGDRKQALDFDASLATATSPELSQYRIVHFATHGLLDATHPELSSLVFSMVDRNGKPQNGFLRLHEVYNLRLPVEMVVLSGCQTALGKDMKGEGVIGLTRGFMYAGALRVVASLWKVDDKATAELMRSFYAGMIGPRRLSPAAALRSAQISMWKQERWKSPFYWAAFVMQGEWKSGLPMANRIYGR